MTQQTEQTSFHSLLLRIPVDHWGAGMTEDRGVVDLLVGGEAPPR